MKKEYSLPLDLLKVLTEAFAPSGCEDRVIELIKASASQYADEIFTDNLGSLIAVYKKRKERAAFDTDTEPEKPDTSPEIDRLMLSAYTDEVGFMVKSIDDKGFLKLAPLGLRDPSPLASRAVTVGDDTKEVCGVIGTKPIHLGSSFSYDSLYADIGASDRDEAKKYVSVGDYGTFRSSLEKFGNGKLKGKALESRIGCSVLLSVLEMLSKSKTALPFDIYFVFTRGRMINFTTASSAASKVKPDLAVLFDSADAKVPLEEGYSSAPALSSGVTVPFFDRGAIYDRDTVDFVTSVAKKCGIPYTVGTPTAKQTDGGAISLSSDGVRSVSVLYPVLNQRTGAEIADISDIDRTLTLAMKMIMSLK